MTTEGHIAALERRHLELEEKIAQELSHPSVDTEMVAALKRKKLEVKDELVRTMSRKAA